jgi:glycosyltransferase involved in cell wall biosynthesis
MKLSLIVPVVRPDAYLANLVRSVAYATSGLAGVELVVVNQSEHSIAPLCTGIEIPLREVRTAGVIPAANARNLGANSAVGDYLFFLDDDAVLLSSSDEMSRLLAQLELGIDALICQRGEIINGVYFSHWPAPGSAITERNFNSFAIEWNFIIRKEIFLEQGGFPEIGAGSKHAALSGEVYVLVAKILGSDHKIQLCEYIRVAHPSLIKSNNNVLNLLGYYYGAGFSVGTSMHFFSSLNKIYWFLRILAAGACDYFFRYKKYQRSVNSIAPGLGRKLLRARFTGFIDGLFDRNLKTRQWLSNLV